MSLHAPLMFKPCFLIIYTTCSLKSVSNTLIDFGLLEVYAILVLTTYRAVCFYQTTTDSFCRGRGNKSIRCSTHRRFVIPAEAGIQTIALLQPIDSLGCALI